jgi:hypothetical protein
MERDVRSEQTRKKQPTGLRPIKVRDQQLAFLRSQTQRDAAGP